MSSVEIIITEYKGTVEINGTTRPFGFCTVKRRKTRAKGKETTRRCVVDKGSASYHFAHQIATSWRFAETRDPRPPIITNVRDIGSIGAFDGSNAGRDALLARAREITRSVA